jgi:hypothetical protein
MPTYEWILHKDKRILYMDISHKDAEDLRDRIATLEPIVEKEPPLSILCLLNIEGGVISSEIAKILKDFAKHNEPYMKMSAVIGMERLQHIIFKTVRMLTDRKNMVIKNSKQEALDWLSEQE